ncbi:uncharacterized protein LOC131646003 [Vicia villosa]|uniref:uncharacterized protein LOC131646003 n=1 Tax=Vicia villosa TaxID=3911 RepID=UPI00273B64C1|nr:uncharacterized protein LOC131646003 [Vicia villosa]
MIFIDKTGGDIHFVVPITHMSLFDEKLALDYTYTLSNFKVQPNVLDFKPSSHKFMLKFTGGKSVRHDSKHEIPSKSLVFTSFFDIITDKFYKDVPDVIGMVESIRYSQTQSGAKNNKLIWY